MRSDFPAAKLADTSSAPSVDDSRALRSAVQTETTRRDHGASSTAPAVGSRMRSATAPSSACLSAKCQ